MQQYAELINAKTKLKSSPNANAETIVAKDRGLHEDPYDSRINGPVEGVSSHEQEGACVQNPGEPSRAAQQPLLQDLLSSDRKQSQQHGGTQRRHELLKRDEISTRGRKVEPA
jgi:hypothetical protein